MFRDIVNVFVVFRVDGTKSNVPNTHEMENIAIGIPIQRNKLTLVIILHVFLLHPQHTRSLSSGEFFESSSRCCITFICTTLDIAFYKVVCCLKK